jgi:beta-glucanase (GH16 family)
VRFSRRLPLVLLVAVALAAGLALGAAAAKSKGFRDDFITFDTSRWVLSSRPFGHGAVDPANVSVAGGQLGIQLPASRLDGGEARTRALYGFGTYRARIRLADAPSSLTAFFLYRAPDYQQEIDIELYNDSSRRIMLSTYSGGAQTNTRTLLLPFDATADYHEYEIDYRSGYVQFLADGTALQTWTTGVPRSTMNVFVNAWFPSWLAGQAPATNRFTYVDWIDVAPR